MADEQVRERSYVAISEKPSANLALEWYAKKAYPRRANNHIRPLINGQVAFATVAAAIKAAKKSIDIISWGFDASMRFERPGGDRIGELLRQRGKEGVKVRLLIWRNKYVQMMENTVPGANQYSGQGAKDLGLSGANRLSGPGKVDNPDLQRLEAEKAAARSRLSKLQTDRQSRLQAQWMNPNGAAAARAIDAEFMPKIIQAQADVARIDAQYKAAQAKAQTEKVEYGSNPGAKVLNSAGAAGDPGAARFNREWHEQAQDGDLKNIEFRTRDFDSWDRSMIRYRQVFESSDQSPWTQLALMALAPSHHQKMVMVDYENPKAAVGFVMGHNMHNNYWDTSSHEFDDSMGLRLPGFGPWQDLSSMITGSVLYDLNSNFVSAWDEGSPWYKRWFDSLQGDRENLYPRDFVTKPDQMRSLAQICRTYPQSGGEQGIREVYMRAAGNARKYIYVENQYFRYPPWADELKATRRKLLAGGRNEAEHGVCHVFVVTNVPDGSGRMRTAEMMQSLGRQDRMPAVYREENKLGADAPVRRSDVAGIKIHVCTLVSDTKQPQKNLNRPIYVHSKLLVVDDAFFTLGSANINTRSMESDSELNIASDDPDTAREWRQRLFGLHTGRGPKDDPAQEFSDWRELMDANSEQMKGGRPIRGKLIEFFDGGGVAAALD